MTGMAHMMAGGVVACKSKCQATVALLSTEAEFTAAAKAGKTTLHLRSQSHANLDASNANQQRYALTITAHCSWPMPNNQHAEPATWTQKRLQHRIGQKKKN